MTEESNKVLEIDCMTGEETVRDLTEQEIAAQQEILKQAEQMRLEMEEKEKARQEALESATEKLTSLGLSPSEIDAIIN